MGKKDVSSIDYLEDSRRIADLLNGYCFHGKQEIMPEHIFEKNYSSRMPMKGHDRKSMTTFRDIVREVQITDGSRMNTIILAMESQTGIHHAMPIKVMKGDCAHYYQQWKSIEKRHKEQRDLSGDEYVSGFGKEDKLVAVITIILYFGDEPWTGPRCLKDMIDMEVLPEEIRGYVADYPIEVVEVKRFQDYDLFMTDLRLVFGFLQRDRDQDALAEYVEENKDAFQRFPADACELLDEFSHIKGAILFGEEEQEERGEYNMCKALEDMRDTAYRKGQESMCKALEDMKATAYKQGQESMQEKMEETKTEAYKQGQESVMQRAEKAEAELARLRQAYAELQSKAAQ